MINKKLSDLFLRKETPRREEKPLTFDENHFQCNLVAGRLNTDLIRVQTFLRDGGQPLDEIRCKWFLKNSQDFREIEGVASEYYQPCLQDVGSIVCVQVEPFLEGRQYTGITIMMESEVLQLDGQLDDQLDRFLQERKVKFDGRIEAIFSQASKYEQIELPLEVKIEIMDLDISVWSGGALLVKVAISQQYPNIEFIRKSFSSILFNFNECESFKISFNNNQSRDLFALITRTCAAHTPPSVKLTPNPESPNSPIINAQKEQEGAVIEMEKEEVKQISIERKGSLVQRDNQQKSVQIEQAEEAKVAENQKVKAQSQTAKQIKQPQPEKKIEKIEKVEKVEKIEKVEEKQSSTMLILKLDEQSRQLKALKRKHDQLQVNYNLERNSKAVSQKTIDNLKNELQDLRKEHEQTLIIAKKVKQMGEDNRFFKNEISILKKELKAAQEKVQTLEAKLCDSTNQQQQLFENKMESAKNEVEEMKLKKTEAERKREDMQADLERLKAQMEEIQNENAQLRKKLQSLSHERIPHPQPLPLKAESKDSEKVRQLEMKLKNLQMLLRYKSGQSEVSSSFQMLVNNLTETISQKELQLNEAKKVNKNLLQQLRQARERSR